MTAVVTCDMRQHPFLFDQAFPSELAVQAIRSLDMVVSVS